MNLNFATDRLTLSPLCSADHDITAAIVTDPKVMVYVGETVAPERINDEMLKWTRRGASGEIGTWLVQDTASGEKLGTAILLPLPIEQDDTDWDLVQNGLMPECEIEIGYLFKPSAWGKGYATEATARLLKFAFEETHLDEIVAVTDPENTASQNVLLKCGMKGEGQRRAYAGQCQGFRISRQSWQQLAGRAV